MRFLLATLTLAAAAAVPAAADETSTHTGRCGFDAISLLSADGTEWTGIAYGAFAVWSPTHGNAVVATVTCEVLVNDVVADSVSGSGIGVVVAAGDVSFTASDADDVGLCTVVDYTSDTTPTTRHCHYSTTTQMPPQEVLDVTDGVFGFVNALGAHVFPVTDPVMCGALGTFAPGSGDVGIEPEGDVYVQGSLFFDCPPFEDGYQYPEPWQPGDIPEIPPLPGHGPSGGGYNTGDAGLLALVTPESTAVTPGGPHLAAGCAFATGGDTVHVLGAVTAPGAAETSVRCRLLDAYDGTVLYDGTAATALRDTIPATGRPITVCTTGTGDDAVVGEHCRLGVPA